MINEVVTFNREVLGIKQRPIAMLSQDEAAYLYDALVEEVDEIDEARFNDSLVGFVDGLLDLCYFAIGGLYRAGLTVKQIRDCFDVIHAANMNKKVGIQMKRGEGKAIDAVKPEGWQAPDEQILAILKGER